MRSQLSAAMVTACLLSAMPAVAQEAAQPKAAQEPQTVTEKLNAAVGKVSNADVDMKRVIDKLSTLGGKPIEELTAEEARKQPTPTDAVKALLKDEGKSAEPPPGVATQEIKVDGATGPLQARVYKSEGAQAFAAQRLKAGFGSSSN